MDIAYPIIRNPEAVGDPDRTPIVQLDQDTADWLTDPANGGCTQCSGINWFHTPTCPSRQNGGA